ncbi:two-component system, OmpR family, response regulator VicR [Anaerobranca californiensis DSM 14826]|jgi:two-component system response regulator VicR|uniref:Stage 0 sporulation protein A homolog n=1 Tax=Anaerobranca californiensis DSM 14826 TaxID=1120989 RepID=A0A1M6M4Z9_9FIRM|nr:response regulator transcription factor [Anaerobranca californiensis]SHJ78373.1 two-component system, OmpR family, response regulator VicR [Anaerobranca californiensis DSM 14826]
MSLRGKKSKILIIDSIGDITLTKDSLENEGFILLHCLPQKFFNLVYNENPDLVLLNLEVSFENYKTCSKIRDTSNCPIIILSDSSEEEDIVKAFEAGADDYIVKPFSNKELVARLKAHLRRYYYLNTRDKNEELLSLEIYPHLQQVKKNERIIDLSQREYELLLFFLKNKGKVFTRGQLLKEVWGFANEGDSRTVDVTIHRLREKIENNPSKPEYILTKRGFGYYFNTVI